MELEGKTAIVTGSAQGIGFGIAKVFAREGATVVINDRNQAGAQKAADELAASGGRAVPFEADVSSEPSLDAMVAATVERHGGVNFLVNNAGGDRAAYLAQDIPNLNGTS